MMNEKKLRLGGGCLGNNEYIWFVILAVLTF